MFGGGVFGDAEFFGYLFGGDVFLCLGDVVDFGLAEAEFGGFEVGFEVFAYGFGEVGLFEVVLGFGDELAELLAVLAEEAEELVVFLVVLSEDDGVVVG